MPDDKLCAAGKFIDFVKGLREDYPDFKLRCVVNEGIKELVLKKVLQERSIWQRQNWGR